MSEDDLSACIGRAQELSSKLLQDGNVANAKLVVADLQRLVGELRRLRQLAIDAEPHVPDNTPTKDLRARLKAEVDRG
jgi:hypothetical protein